MTNPGPPGGFRPRWHRTARVVTLATATAVPGCYQYVPVSPASPDPGSVIRVDVDDEAATALTSVLGPGVLRVNGRLLDRTDESVSILVESYQTSRSGELSGLGDPVSLPIHQITHVEQKRLSRGRSLLLGVAFVGGALAMTEIFAGDERVFDPDDPNDPGEPQRRRLPGGVWPGFRILFR